MLVDGLLLSNKMPQLRQSSSSSNKTFNLVYHLQQRQVLVQNSDMSIRDQVGEKLTRKCLSSYTRLHNQKL